MGKHSDQKPSSANIIGAGVVGIATAYALARRGVDVTIIDQHDGPGEGASFANGAQLSYCYTDALASPGLIAQMPRLVLRLEEAFRFRWKWDIDYWRWLAKFLENCTSRRFNSNTLVGLDLAQQSQQSMQQLLDSHELQFGHRVAGKMHLYSTGEAFDQARKILALKKGGCPDQQILFPDEAIAIEPALAQLNGSLAGAIYSPDEAVGDAHGFSREMLDLLKREYDVKTHFGLPVEDIDLSNNQASVRLGNGDTLQSDITILCAGVQSAKLAKPLGIYLPIQPLKGYSFTAPPGSIPPKTSITDTARRIVFTNLGDRIRVAGLADLGDGDVQVKSARISALINSARVSMPEAVDYDSVSNIWTGLRPMTPNSLPIISRPRPTLAINTGHGALGWTLAMGSADRLANLVAPD
ncbi:MAG: FAD-dependent oxidoreductase [Parasphingorhabdus sp.]|uniref:FAD-dependent oxidoreductase n=1 Tax=Parasphingorhabdus sp. TaxID=2709688 RepID=UPI0032970515